MCTCVQTQEKCDTTQSVVESVSNLVAAASIVADALEAQGQRRVAWARTDASDAASLATYVAVRGVVPGLASAAIGCSTECFRVVCVCVSA